MTCFHCALYLPMAASFGEKAFAWTIYWQLTISNSFVTVRHQSGPPKAPCSLNTTSWIAIHRLDPVKGRSEEDLYLG